MVKSTLALLFVSAGLFVALVYFANYHPAEREPVAVHCTDSAPQVERGKPLKVMTWNIQYMAGKNYVFFYDRLDGSGPDNRPSSKDIAMTLDEVVRVVRDEQPDVVLFQEVDEGAKRTNYANQTQLLLDRLGSLYPCSAEVFYWRSKFVPHPRVMGSVGLKLVTLSRFEIQSAVRHRLAQVPMDVLSRRLDRLIETGLVIIRHGNTIDHDFNRMFFLFIQVGNFVETGHRSIHPNSGKSLFF